MYIFLLNNIHKVLAKYGLSIAGKARCIARSVDRLIKNTPDIKNKGDVQMKKLLKAFGMAIMDACAIYAENFCR